MKRNIEKAIEQGHKIIQQNEHFDLCLSEMEELIGMSDRILVLHEGEMMGEVPKERFDSRYILKLASGMKED